MTQRSGRGASLTAKPCGWQPCSGRSPMRTPAPARLPPFQRLMYLRRGPLHRRSQRLLQTSPACTAVQARWRQHGSRHGLARRSSRLQSDASAQNCASVEISLRARTETLRACDRGVASHCCPRWNRRHPRAHVKHLPQRPRATGLPALHACPPPPPPRPRYNLSLLPQPRRPPPRPLPPYPHCGMVGKTAPPRTWPPSKTPHLPHLPQFPPPLHPVHLWPPQGPPQQYPPHYSPLHLPLHPCGPSPCTP